MIKISPSILSADFTKLGSDIESIKNADYIHFDVMDGMFVPNLSFGFPVLKAVRAISDKPLDVHLMIEAPHRYISRFIEAGGDIITLHIESEVTEQLRESINIIHEMGKKAGLSIKPKTPAQAVLPYLERLDLVLVMTVEPGYGGQKFIPETLQKITELRCAIDKVKPKCDLEVDGGINLETARLCIDSGANVLVAGVDIFDAADRAAHIEELRNLPQPGRYP